jgi:hypothetical protein
MTPKRFFKLYRDELMIIALWLIVSAILGMFSRFWLIVFTWVSVGFIYYMERRV